MEEAEKKAREEQERIYKQLSEGMFVVVNDRHHIFQQLNVVFSLFLFSLYSKFRHHP